MKRLLSNLVAPLAIACSIFAAGPALAQIAASAHNFSTENWSRGQICIVCHTPHNANTNVANAPLWNHALTTATYQVYSSPTMDATIGQPSGVSKLCLSCHDGTVAVDSFGHAVGTEYIDIDSDSNLGTNLSANHPISFTYDRALAQSDGQIYDPTVTSSGLGGTITKDMLHGGKMECSSCHDVHNSRGGTSDLLIKSNAGSALCLTCHDM